MKDYIVFAIILRFTVDFLLLLAADRISAAETGPLRLILAAALGGLHAAACTVPGMGFLGSYLWQTVGMLLMCLVAYDTDRHYFHRGAVFCLLRLSLDGLAANTGKTQDIIWAAVLCAVFLYSFRGGMGWRKLVPVELYHGGKTVKLQALRDTGNTLRDPVTGKPVLVVDSKIADALTGLKPGQLMSPVETIGAIPGLRLIPYRAVGRQGGLLLGLHVKRSRIGRRKGSAMVAFAPQVLDEKGCYQALLGEAF